MRAVSSPRFLRVQRALQTVAFALFVTGLLALAPSVSAVPASWAATAPSAATGQTPGQSDPGQPFRW